jgi:hypothetical protein
MDLLLSIFGQINSFTEKMVFIKLIKIYSDNILGILLELRGFLGSTESGNGNRNGNGNGKRNGNGIPKHFGNCFCQNFVFIHF